MHGHDLILLNENVIGDVLRNSVMIEIGSNRETGSTASLANMAKMFNAHFVTVDPDRGAFNRSSEILRTIDSSYEAKLDYGENFLKEYSGDIAVIYLDAFDIILPHWPHKQSTIDTYSKRNQEITNESAWKMHLDAMMNCEKNIVKGGYVCFDDTWYKDGLWDGKGRLGVPYALGKGYEIVGPHDSHCVILRK